VNSSLITVYAVSGFSVTTTETESNSTLTQTTTYTYSDEVASYLTTITVTPSPTPVTPYSQGNCNLHLTQWTDASAINKPYTFEVTMWDNNKEHKIGYTKVAGFADGDPLSVESKLEDKLVVTQINPPDQSQSEYLQFNLGAQKWASTDKLDQHTPGCHLGVLDGSNNPSVSL